MSPGSLCAQQERNVSVSENQLTPLVPMQITSCTFKTSVRGLAPRDAYFGLTVFHGMSLLQMLGMFAPCHYTVVFFYIHGWPNDFYMTSLLLNNKNIRRKTETNCHVTGSGGDIAS